MSSFGLDNAGSGFNLEDDEDLESMLGRASAASEDDGDLNFGPRQSSQSVPEPEPQSQFDFSDGEGVSQEQPTEEPVAAEPAVEEEAEVIEPEPEMNQEPYVEPYVEPAPVEPAPVAVTEERSHAPEPAYSTEPMVTPPTAPGPNRARVRVPSEQEQVADAARVISIIDVYRKLSAEEKTVTVQFVTNGDMDTTDDATLVVKVLNADPMLTTTMRALREAYEHDLVERAFYAMSLDTKTLHSLGSLVSVFSDKEYDESLSNLAYSRDVVASIAELGDREINFVKATESVLAAAEIATD